jgi:hypothetical protein
MQSCCCIYINFFVDVYGEQIQYLLLIKITDNIYLNVDINLVSSCRDDNSKGKEMSIILILLALYELLFKKRSGRFFLLITTALILFIKNNTVLDYSFWDLSLVILLTTFVINRYKADHRQI